MLDLIKFDKNFIEAFMMKGDIYADMKKYDSSIVYYKKSIDIDPYLAIKSLVCWFPQISSK